MLHMASRVKRERIALLPLGSPWARAKNIKNIKIISLLKERGMG